MAAFVLRELTLTLIIIAILCFGVTVVGDIALCAAGAGGSKRALAIASYTAANAPFPRHSSTPVLRLPINTGASMWLAYLSTVHDSLSNGKAT